MNLIWLYSWEWTNISFHCSSWFSFWFFTWIPSRINITFCFRLSLRYFIL